MEKTLEMIFKTESGAKKIVSIKNPKDDVTNAEATAVGNTIVTKNIFESKQGDLAEYVEARIVSKDVEALA